MKTNLFDLFVLIWICIIIICVSTLLVSFVEMLKHFHEIIIITLVLSVEVLFLKHIFFRNITKDRLYKPAKETELEENLKKVKEWSRPISVKFLNRRGKRKTKKENKFNINILYIEV